MNYDATLIYQELNNITFSNSLFSQEKILYFIAKNLHRLMQSSAIKPDQAMNDNNFYLQNKADIHSASKATYDEFLLWGTILSLNFLKQYLAKRKTSHKLHRDYSDLASLDENIMKTITLIFKYYLQISTTPQCTSKLFELLHRVFCFALSDNYSKEKATELAQELTMQFAGDIHITNYTNLHASWHKRLSILLSNKTYAKSQA